MSQEVNYKHDKEKQKVWFPYSVSAEPDDFIVQNGVHGHCPDVVCDETCHEHNPRYWQNLKISDVINNTPEIGCFGCSFTYGSFLPESETWPNLLQQSLQRQTGNFGVPGGGADACLTNLVNAHHHFGINTAIVLFPVMDRRLLKFKKKNLFFQLPIGPHSEWPYDEFASRNYFNGEFIHEMIAETKNQITLDVVQKYSKEKILQIQNFCREKNIKLYTSSWDSQTMNFLRDHNFCVLPAFDMTVTNERAGDLRHPCKVHNANWVSMIEASIM